MREDYKRKLVYLENPKISLELFDAILGDFIGSGCSREVFQHPYEKNWVVKVENGGMSGDNFSEYNVWQSVKYTENAKWFAPCEYISPNGMILIQRKTSPLYGATKNKIPEKIPWFFTDLHCKNFGWIGKQMVAHDYAFTTGMITSNVAASKRMQTTKNKL